MVFKMFFVCMRFFRFTPFYHEPQTFATIFCTDRSSSCRCHTHNLFPDTQQHSNPATHHQYHTRMCSSHRRSDTSVHMCVHIASTCLVGLVFVVLWVGGGVRQCNPSTRPTVLCLSPACDVLLAQRTREMYGIRCCTSECYIFANILLLLSLFRIP